MHSSGRSSWGMVPGSGRGSVGQCALPPSAPGSQIPCVPCSFSPPSTWATARPNSCAGPESECWHRSVCAPRAGSATAPVLLLNFVKTALDRGLYNDWVDLGQGPWFSNSSAKSSDNKINLSFFFFFFRISKQKGNLAEHHTVMFVLNKNACASASLFSFVSVPEAFQIQPLRKHRKGPLRGKL